MRALRDAETNFRNFFETIEDIFIISTLDGDIIHGNKAVVEKLQYSLEELKIMNVVELYPEDQRGEANKVVDEIIKNKKDYCSLELKSKSGEIFSVETRIFFGKWNEQECIYRISKDMTKTMALTRDLEDKLEKFTNVVEATNLGTWEWHVQTSAFEINEQWANMIGYLGEELRPATMETWASFVHPEDLKVAIEMLEKHLKDVSFPYEVEIRMKHKDGRWIWVQTRGKVITRDEEGKPVQMFGTHLNVTSRKEASQALKESEKRFFLALDETKAGLWDYDMINRKVYLSNMWKEILGYSPEEIGDFFDSAERLWHPDDLEKMRQTSKDHLEGKSKRYETIHRLLHKDGNWRWILTRGGILRDEDGVPYRWIGTNLDITTQREQALELERFLSVNLDLLCTVDMNGCFLKTNKAWEELLGYPAAKLKGQRFLDFVHPDDIPSTLMAMEEGKEGKEVLKFVNRYRGADHSYRYIEWRSTPFDGIIYAAARDITERTEHEERILEISNRDALTNAYNRRYVFKKAEEIIEEYKRRKKAFSVCILDIDYFKKINDSYGHQAGEHILKAFTKVISENLRPYDVLGRYGGEEFIVILNNSDQNESNLVIQRMLDVIRNKAFNFNDERIKFTFSAGIVNSSEIDKTIITIDKLVEIADKRMYQAKKTGRNKILSK